MTPSLLKSLGNDVPHSVKHLLLGGEAFPDLEFPVRTNLKIYNIYGLTEMSVWQSLVNVLPINNQSITPVPICQKKNLLRDTEVKVCADGEIVVFSKTRSCCVDGIWQFEVKTKDLGFQKENGYIYYKGRLDQDVFKIHGRRLSVNEIQAKWTEVFQATSYCVLTDEKRLLAYVIIKVNRIFLLLLFFN